MQEYKLSVIVPVYNEQEVLLRAHGRFKGVLDALGCEYELIYIDDGSADDTWQLLQGVCEQDETVTALSFSRNFGHQMAVTAGIDQASGDCAVIIDADLQDPPELIPQMMEKWRGGFQIVYGQRKKREGETFLKKMTASMYYRILASLSSVKIPLDVGDFRLIDRSVINLMKQMREHNRFLRGMSAWAGFKSCPVEYDRDERAAGTSKYTLKKMLKLAADGIFSFSSKPLTLVLAAGAAICALSLMGMLAALITALCGVWVAGWLWAFLGLALMQGMVLTGVGITGVYISRMYDELKGRPLYIIASKIGKHVS